MRAVGIREIKDKLSKYLGYVREGETVLVTDRGKVVAQLAPPPVYAPTAHSDDEALARLAAAGKVRLAGRRIPSPGEAAVPGAAGRDYRAALDEARSERSR